MSKTRIPASLRQLVRERAGNVCEYCLIHADDTYFLSQIDHIVSEKHGGQTDANNLAFSCALCNRHKGSNVATLLYVDQPVRLYNPRTDRWSAHFVLDGIKIAPKTLIAEATIKVLMLNETERLVERAYLSDIGRYPTTEALARI